MWVAQVAADGLGDLAERDALILNRVPVSACWPLLERQAEQGGDIAGVYGIPQVGAVPGVTGEALLLRQRDQDGEEAGTIGRAVRERKESARPKSALPRSARSMTALSTTLRTRRVPLCSSPTGRAGSSSVAGRPIPGRANAPCRDQRLSGASESLAVREHDRKPGGHGVHPAKGKQFLPVRDVNDTVGIRGCLHEPFEVLEVASAHLRAERGDRRCSACPTGPSQ